MMTAVVAAAGQDSGDAAAKGLTADLGRYYFASPEAEVAARAELESALGALGGFKGQIDSGEKLLGALRAYEEVLRIYHRHEGYLHLRCAQDRSDGACEAREKLEAEADAKTAFLTPEILGIPKERLKEFYGAEPKLKSYEYAVAEMRREEGHVLPVEQQELLDRFEPEIGDWQYDLYERVVAGIAFGKVETAAGPQDVLRQRRLLAESADGKVREEAFKKRLNGYASQRDLLAFALMHTVRAQEALAKAHRYANAPDRKYTSLGLEPEQTRALLEAMAQHGEIAKRFEKLRARDFEEAYGKPMQAWDASAPLPGFVAPVTTLAEAPAIYHGAFAGLGAEYQEAFDALLDAKNGRADVLPGGAAKRYAGGFSIGFAGSRSILFYGRFDGTFKDLSVIAHEGGHAAHRELMSGNGVKPVYCTGPNYLFESFAAFNELLLAEYQAEHAKDERLRRYYREQWMGIKGLDAWYGAQDALLEQKIYDGVAAGRVRNADDLDQLTAQVDGEFSMFAAGTPELKNRWATMSLMYEDPSYDVNYVYGGLLALKYYEMYQANRVEFAKKYVALLKNGFDAAPAELLKQFLGIDLGDGSLLKGDMELLERRLGELEGEK